MRKPLSLFLLVLLGISVSQAASVDEETAKQVGRQFVATVFEQERQSTDLELVFTGTSKQDTPVFYVFEVGETGFVIVSADDRFRPIVGYSDEGAFDVENRSPELDYYLEKIIEARCSSKAVLYEDAAAEWKTLVEGGRPMSRNRGKEASYLCETTWNQNTPYNLYAPEASSGPGGRCYAGCVATAMSQLMKFWDHPATGTGSHSYWSSYGHLSANFGATTYQWDHMPNAIHSSSTPTEDIEAIALLMYHCGVAVDMMFGPNGSGAYSDDVPYAIQHYFSYSNHTEHLYRDYYSLEQWKAILREQFDLGWPVYYSGYSNSGGHAFVCDGYDDNDLFHFNWGWGGSSDGWFVVDEIDYANWSSIIKNFVPTHVYENMPMNPTNLVVESLGDSDFSASLSWTNPSLNIHGQTLASLDKVVVCRDGNPIYTFNNPAPGQDMTFTDHYIPTVVSYSVYAVANMANGAVAKSDLVTLGPSCNWMVSTTSSNPQGWDGAAIIITDGKGVEFASISPNTVSETYMVNMPMGSVSFSWKEGQHLVENIHFEIVNAEGVNMASFDGSSADIISGVFYKAVNACQTGEKTAAPIHLTATTREDGTLLQWEMKETTDCSFFVYRDGKLYDKISATNYLDSSNDNLFHTYYVTAYNGVMESDPSNSCNIQMDSDCLIPTKVRYTILSKDKIKLSWDAPQASGVSGYRIYRRARGEAFSRIKNLTTSSFETSLISLSCEQYEYAVSAYYSQLHCESAYGTSYENPTLNYVEVNKTVIPMHLDCDVMEEGVKLVWLAAMIADSYSIYRNGVLLAEGITDSWYLDETAENGHDYCYTVVGSNAFLTSNLSNEICVDWSTMKASSSETKNVQIYPNPASDQVCVSATGMRSLAVINLLGQVVLTKETEGDLTVLDLRTLNQGAYFIKVMADNGTTTVKFVKK